MKDVAHKIVQDVIRIRQTLGHYPTRAEYDLHGGKYGSREYDPIITRLGGWLGIKRAAGQEEEQREKYEPREPKVLVFDIETSPMVVLVFGLFDQNVGLNQILKDRHLLSFAAMWAADAPTKVIYRDQRNVKNIADDKKICLELRDLLDEADVVVTQNGKKFDAKIVNARLAIHGIKPPSPYKHIDTLTLARKHFGFTSNKLEYLLGKLCPKTQKDAHKNFPGMDLWKECLNGNAKAWEEMRTYNIADVIGTHALYKKLAPWGAGVDLNVYHGDAVFRCHCGSTDLTKRGYSFTTTGKFQRYLCNACGTWSSRKGAGNNLFSLKKKMSLKGPA